LAEFLDGDLEIAARAWQSPQLQRHGGEDMLDELRVLIRDKAGTSAYFCFSTQIKGLNQLAIYGPGGSLIVDHASGSLIRKRNRSYKSYLTYFIPPLRSAREYFQNACANITNFLRRRLYQDFGMKELIERFYESVRTNSAPPIPYREIILTARIMDEIFAQIYPGVARKAEVGGQKSAIKGQKSDGGNREALPSTDRDVIPSSFLSRLSSEI